MKYSSQFFKSIVRPYFLVLTIVITVSMTVLYYATELRIKNSITETGGQLAEKSAQQTQMFINEMDQLAEQVKRQSKILSTFYSLSSSENRENYFDTNILDNLDISTILKNLLADRARTVNIIIYNNCGDFISSHEYLIKTTDLTEVLSHTYYGALSRRADDAGRLVTAEIGSKWTDDSELYVTLTKPLKNDYSGSICGIIEVRCTMESMAQGINLGSAGANERIQIINATTGNTIYPPDSVPMSDAYVSAEMLIDGTDWKIHAELENPMKGSLRTQMLVIFAFVYLLLVAIMFLLTMLIGRYVTRPLSELTERVRRIKEPREQLRLKDDTAIDEVRELGDSFDKMLERMNKSLEQEKKAYALSVQAQMNPHFLYNILAVIGSAGAENGCDKVADMCVELSDMLRYITAYETVTVPLREETEHTKNYLSLMKSRYEELFTYSLIIDEALLDMPVPKLLIQPLAENCFKHGFKNKQPPWSIDIRLTGTRRHWELSVRDNGEGISEDRIIEIKNKISNALSSMAVGTAAGLGIVNTVTRLKLTHSDEISYEIKNENGMVLKITSG